MIYIYIADLGFEIFPCVKLFDFTLVNSYSCRWIDSISLEVRISAGTDTIQNDIAILRGILNYNAHFNAVRYMINVGDVIKLRNNVLKAFCPETIDCTLWSYCASSDSITISNSQSQNSLSPIIKINAPTLIGRCDDFVLDFMNSISFQGGIFHNLDISVFSTTTGVLSDQINSINDYLHQNFMV